MFEQENTFESDRIGMIYVAIISADAGHTDRLMAGLRARKKKEQNKLHRLWPNFFPPQDNNVARCKSRLAMKYIWWG